jgi:hypothetical protein
MDLGEVGWGDVDWIGLAQARKRWRALVNSVLNLPVPWNGGKLSSGPTSSGLSSSAQLHRVSYMDSFCFCHEGIVTCYHFRVQLYCIIRKEFYILWTVYGAINVVTPAWLGDRRIVGSVNNCMESAAGPEQCAFGPLLLTRHGNLFVRNEAIS